MRGQNAAAGADEGCIAFEAEKGNSAYVYSM